jgi:predicted GIY-YIG superfamily endonuclease
MKNMIKKEKIIQKTKDYKFVIRNSSEHRLLALKAAKQAGKVLPIFERENPKDKRPRKAIEALKDWAHDREGLGMACVRKISLDSHAAARQAKSEAARFAARAAGQAIATWHVPNHALGVSYYIGKIIALKKDKSMYCVYIIECKDGSFYTGITNDINRRFKEHSLGKGGAYTKAKGIEKLLYIQKCGSRSEALKREAEIKSWSRKKKADLIKKKFIV